MRLTFSVKSRNSCLLFGNTIVCYNVIGRKICEGNRQHLLMGICCLSVGLQEQQFKSLTSLDTDFNLSLSFLYYKVSKLLSVSQTLVDFHTKTVEQISIKLSFVVVSNFHPPYWDKTAKVPKLNFNSLNRNFPRFTESLLKGFSRKRKIALRLS